MKIAVDVLPLMPDGSAGGVTGVTLELVRGMAQCNDIELILLCTEFNIVFLKKALGNSIKYLIVNDKKTFMERFFDKLFCYRKKSISKILIHNKVDLLFCPYSAVNFYTQAIPVVSTINDIQHEYYPQFFDKAELEHRKKFYANIVKTASSVICISEYTKKTFCEKYGFPTEKAYTIYIAIQNRFTKQDNNILSKLGLASEEYLVYPANFWEHKNHRLLLMSFGMYLNENKKAKLVLTGNVLKQEKYYEKVIEALKLENNVIITGYLTNEELYCILFNAKGLVYPSLFEGFGIPIVEAMQMKKLIACSNATSLTEIGCSAIYYFNPKKPDEIVNGLRYLYNKKIDIEMKNEYEKTLDKYCCQYMVQQYLNVFRSVLADKECMILRTGFVGIDEDGWGRKEIYIQVKDNMGAILKIGITVPDFLHRNLNIRVINNGSTKKYIGHIGQYLELTEPIISNEAIINIVFSRVWEPHHYLNNSDFRQLSVKVNCLEIVSNYRTEKLI